MPKNRSIIPKDKLIQLSEFKSNFLPVNTNITPMAGSLYDDIKKPAIVVIKARNSISLNIDVKPKIIKRLVSQF